MSYPASVQRAERRFLRAALRAHRLEVAVRPLKTYRSPKIRAWEMASEEADTALRAYSRAIDRASPRRQSQ